MLNGNKVVVVMPAYKAQLTLKKTYNDIDRSVVDEIILVDDDSPDDTLLIAKQLGIYALKHQTNVGYGANQKTCYTQALNRGADIVVMVHPDYQYNPKLISSLASLISCGVYDVALGSRILGNTALSGGMPVYKYIANRFLTLIQNFITGAKLSEYHTGFRAFKREVLLNLPLHANTDDFAFDNEMLAQIIAFDYKIGEISCPTRYFEDASSIKFSRSIKYGLEVLKTSVNFFLWKHGIRDHKIFINDNNMKISITKNSES